MYPSQVLNAVKLKYHVIISQYVLNKMQIMLRYHVIISQYALNLTLMT